MEHPFFPSAAFAWTFYLALVGLTATAAVVDIRRFVVPKWLTLPTLALGVAFSIARVAWLGAEGKVTRVLLVPVGGAWSGALAGLQFALLGCLFGFALFFVMWALGTCGGGDVKLFAAVGAWGGIDLTLFLLVGTVVFVTLLVVAKFVGLPLSPKGGGKRGPLAAYAPAVALSAAVVLLWLFRAEMLPQVDPPSGGPATAQRGR
jgi:Flp pilus assembly protein protease CpaA